MQGRERSDGQLLDAGMLVGHLVPAGSMFAFLAAHRQELFDEDHEGLIPRRCDGGGGSRVRRPDRISDAVRKIVAETGVLKGAGAGRWTRRFWPMRWLPGHRDPAGRRDRGGASWRRKPELGERAAAVGLLRVAGRMSSPLRDRRDDGVRRGGLAAHRRFHLAIYAASHNRVLAGILGQLWDRTDRYRIIVLRDRELDDGTGAEHRQIAEAIRSRQTTVADSLMRHHVEQALRSVERIAKVEAGS